jgi:isopentenyl phosphate kinase
MAKPLVPIIVKLGGSVVTYKDTLFKPNISVIDRLVKEILKANIEALIVVHGAGSYGHPVAMEYKINDGYKNPDQLIGFSKTRQAMMALNKIIIDAFIEQKLPAVSVQPSAFIVTEKGRIEGFDTTIIRKLLNLKMIPILYGDAVVDKTAGFSIISGDQIINELTVTLRAEKIIFGIDIDGLFTDDPKRNPDAKFVEKITFEELQALLDKIGIAGTIDVTGGMYGKISELIRILEKWDKAVIKIINAKQKNRLFNALIDETIICTEIRRR